MDGLTKLSIGIGIFFVLALIVYHFLGVCGKLTRPVKVIFKCSMAAVICIAYLCKFCETFGSPTQLTFLGGMIYVEVFLMVFSGLTFLVGLVLDGEQLLMV
ncbi:MAG TPA: hypothetical protein VMD52_05605 [Patescibacteria group bacterium]|nr:hypothetical protein [Patescibacteria group bacterium]